MYQNFKSYLENELSNISEAGLYKNERIIISAQGAAIRVLDGKEVLNFCANNYLGLSNNPSLIQAAKDALRHPWLWYVVGTIYLRNARPS